MLRTLHLLVWLLIPAVLLAQNPAQNSDDDEAIKSSGQPLSIAFKNRPSLRLGEFAHVDLKTKWHLDFRGFDPPRWNAPGIVNGLPTTPPTFNLTRARIGLKGKV